MRPRANTLSHIDANTLDLLTISNNNGSSANAGNAHQGSDSAVIGVPEFEYRGLSNITHSSLHSLPRLKTNALPTEHSGGLRTAPAYGGFPDELTMNTFAFGLGNTINPNQLHMGGMQGFSMDDTGLQYPCGAPTTSRMLQGGEDFDWMAQGLENQRFFRQTNDSALEESSPSVMDSNSPDGVSDSMLDCSASIFNGLSVSTPQIWNGPFVRQGQMMTSPGNLDYSACTFNDMVPAPQGTISPKSLLAQGGSLSEMNMPSPSPLNAIEQPSILPGFVAPGFQVPGGMRTGGASTASASSSDSGPLQSSITTASTDLINEHTRSSVLTKLLQYSSFSQRPYCQPTISSPLSPNSASGVQDLSLNNFPSTLDLQRYLAAYVQCFHPHLPFLHIPTLNFESSEYSIPSRMMNRESHFDHNSVSGGGGCLMLAITAIGALYELEMTQSKKLFEASKHMIGGFLEERRRVNLNRNGFEPRHQGEAETTPLWLVQAMLLNVIYGYNCGDKTSAEIACNHCATLVSLARGAELSRPYPGYMVMTNGTLNPDLQMNEVELSGWSSVTNDMDDIDWQEWKIVEERKRTLYAVFILSSLLVTAYNHPPALTNSEIRVSLPCKESLWTADNAVTWRAMSATSGADDPPIMFNAALGHLLTASQRQQQHQAGSIDPPFGPGIRVQASPQSDLKPSTFGCLILINALHNYIWETRQRHLGRQWTNHDMEQMHAHIEPALRAWQAAWAEDPTHSIERPNPFGASPLSADCIPLLDLAYVRLFVNFGRSKEAFWQRDFDTMADGLAQATDLFHDASQSPSSSYEESHTTASTNTCDSRRGSVVESRTADTGQLKICGHDGFLSVLGSNSMQQPESLALRERYLREAAFYAADSLAMSDKLGVSFAEHTSRELPLQSAMCAFDCAQVLAEWINTVQDRIGRYAGIIGSADVDNTQAASLILLEDEDRNLLDKISHVLHNAESKSMSGCGTNSPGYLGYGSRILLSTAHMLERATIWPGGCTPDDLACMMTDVVQ